MGEVESGAKKKMRLEPPQVNKLSLVIGGSDNVEVVEGGAGGEVLEYDEGPITQIRRVVLT